MNRKILFLITILALSSAPVFISGCSSSEEQTDSAGVDDGLDGGDLGEEGGAASENPSSEADVSGTPVDGAPPADAPAADAGNTDDIVADLGDDPTGETDPGAALPDQAMGDAPPPADAPIADNNVPPPADSMDAGAPPDAPPPLGAEADMPVAAPMASLKKIKDTPFKSNGRILNTVYVARKGDTTAKVAEKVFGDKKRKKELVADNAMLGGGRGVKEGDKIYYNSSRRPDDTTTMMTFYEDNGVPAQSYVAKDGDDLKKVAKDILGSKNGWKELWVTNANLESKGALTAGTEIRYWTAAPDTVAAAPAPPDVPPDAPPPPPAAGTTAPPPPDLNNMPPPSDAMPPPPPPTGDMNAMPPPPPPPPDAGMANSDFPPPPPPPGANGAKKGGPEDLLFQDQETTMAIGAGAIILLSVILIAVSRIKRNRAQRMRLGQTQV